MGIFAYIDAGSGSLILQAMVAGIVAVALFAGQLKNRFAAQLKAVRVRRHDK